MSWWLGLFLFTATLIGTGSASLAPVALSADTASWETVATADFDGDGKQDKVLGYPSGVPGSFRTIAVEGVSGAILLQRSIESNYWEVLVADFGGEHPLLVLGTPSGNWLQLEAFEYRPTSRRMEPVLWDRENFLFGREPFVEPTSKTLSVYTERGYQTYQFKRGAFHRVK